MGDGDINPSSELGDGNMCRLSFRSGVWGLQQDLGPDLGLVGDSTGTCPGQRHRQAGFLFCRWADSTCPGPAAAGREAAAGSWLGTDGMP